MRPNKYDWLALEAAKAGMAGAIKAVPSERRPAVYDRMKAKQMNDYQLQSSIGHDSMSGVSLQGLCVSLRQHFVGVRTHRQSLWRTHQGLTFMQRMEQESVHLLHKSLHAKPRNNFMTGISVGTSTKFLGFDGTIGKFSVSPGYGRFVKKLGAGSVGYMAFLNGERIGTPFDGGEIWWVEGFDTKKLYQTPVYVGVCNGTYRTASSVQRCLSAITKIATTAVFGAMEGETPEE
jgi:hypothetical protein